jgi:hypothetical protein
VDRAFGVDQEIENPFVDPIDPDQGPFKLLGSVDEEIEALGTFDSGIHGTPS